MAAASVTSQDLMGMGFRLDPWPVWERLRHDHPVFWHEAANQWVITRYDDVCAVFADNEHFSNSLYAHTLGVVFGRTMLELDGAEHVSLRKVVSPELVGNNLGRYLDVIRRESAALIDAFPDGPVELVSAFTNRMPVNVIVAMLGMPGDDHDRFHDWYSTMMASLVFGKPERRPAGIAAREELMAHVAPAIESRTACPMGDLISRMLVAEADGRRLTRDEVEAFISLMFVAGGETTDKAITNTWANLLRDPDQLALVQADPGRFDAAFSEMMRHSPPVMGQARLCVADWELHGSTIKAGDLVSISIASANNDETVFADPRRFDLERPDLHEGKELRRGGRKGGRSGHLGFGLGKHFCLGYEMARAETVIGSQLLLERFPEPVEAGDPQPFLITDATRSVASLTIASR
jgi:pulcherriminic acid synthase